MVSVLRRLTTSRCGTASIEYSMVVALVAVTLVVGLRSVGSTLDTVLTTISVEADGGVQSIEGPPPIMVP